MNIEIKRLKHAEGLALPLYATENSAGIDLIAAIDKEVVLTPGKHALIQTGIAIALPNGYEAQIRPRSGLALKWGITVLNSPGTIDADYRGEIGVILINHGDCNLIIERGMRIAQMVIAQYTKINLTLVSELSETVRGEDGFGSTGTK